MPLPNPAGVTTLTFDCYGTLIDWETGAIDALRPLLARHGVTLLYQTPYLLTALAQVRRVMEARRSGVLISLFQASQQAFTMAL